MKTVFLPQSKLQKKTLLSKSSRRENTFMLLYWVYKKKSMYKGTCTVHTHVVQGSTALFHFIKEGNSAIWDNTDEPGRYYAKCNKPVTERIKL